MITDIRKNKNLFKGADKLLQLARIVQVQPKRYDKRQRQQKKYKDSVNNALEIITKSCALYTASGFDYKKYNREYLESRIEEKHFVDVLDEMIDKFYQTEKTITEQSQAAKRLSTPERIRQLKKKTAQIKNFRTRTPPNVKRGMIGRTMSDTPSPLRIPKMWKIPKKKKPQKLVPKPKPPKQPEVTYRDLPRQPPGPPKVPHPDDLREEVIHLPDLPPPQSTTQIQFAQGTRDSFKMDYGDFFTGESCPALQSKDRKKRDFIQEKYYQLFVRDMKAKDYSDDYILAANLRKYANQLIRKNKYGILERDPKVFDWFEDIKDNQSRHEKGHNYNRDMWRRVVKSYKDEPPLTSENFTVEYEKRFPPRQTRDVKPPIRSRTVRFDAPQQKASRNIGRDAFSKRREARRDEKKAITAVQRGKDVMFGQLMIVVRKEKDKKIAFSTLDNTLKKVDASIDSEFNEMNTMKIEVAKGALASLEHDYKFIMKKLGQENVYSPIADDVLTKESENVLRYYFQQLVKWGVSLYKGSESQWDSLLKKYYSAPQLEHVTPETSPQQLGKTETPKPGIGSMMLSGLSGIRSWFGSPAAKKVTPKKSAAPSFTTIRDPKRGALVGRDVPKFSPEKMDIPESTHTVTPDYGPTETSVEVSALTEKLDSSKWGTLELPEDMKEEKKEEPPPSAVSTPQMQITSGATATPQSDYEATQQHFLDIRRRKAERYAAAGGPLTSFDVSSVTSTLSDQTMRTVGTRRSAWSMRAHYERPIDRGIIIKLKDLKRQMGEKVELFNDTQLLGFDKPHWEKRVYEKFPIDLSKGFKKSLGTYIKTSYDKPGKKVLIKIYRRATAFQLNSLIGYLEGKCPPFNYMTLYRFGKVFEEVYNVGGFQDFLHFIQNQLHSSPSVYLKLQW